MMVIYVLSYFGKEVVDFTSDYSFYYYFKPIIPKMWYQQTLGM